VPLERSVDRSGLEDFKRVFRCVLESEPILCSGEYVLICAIKFAIRWVDLHLESLKITVKRERER
jgi:hypothetical protein